MSSTHRFARAGRLAGTLAALSATALAVSSAALAAPAPPPPAKTPLSATLEQCVGEGPQAERSATFAGEMAAIPGAARLEMRIDVLERGESESAYHAVTAPGLGVWRGSAPGVKVYRYLKQVTNLSGPAYYRAVVRYRWLSAHGRVIAASTLRTKRCEQPQTEIAPAPPAPPASLHAQG